VVKHRKFCGGLAMLMFALAGMFPLGAQIGPANSLPPSRKSGETARSSSPPPVVSPEVLADRSVVFRLRAPAAAKVDFAVIPGAAKPMTKDGAGVWFLTVGPLDPEIYRYHFVVDGLRVTDPVNDWIEIGRKTSTSLFEVPGSPARIEERRAGEGGTLHIRHYASSVLGVTRRTFIHVPAAYDREPARRFPVLYLRHGASGLESSWSDLGRAGVILDNLVAVGRAVPMIIVMPNGYADRPRKQGTPVPFGQESRDATRTELLEDIIPLIERIYRVQKGPEHRAIAGLSMGAGQAFFTGLMHPDQFAWVAEFGSGAFSEPKFDLATAIPGLLEKPEATNARLRLLFLSCGTEDPRYNGQLRLHEALKHHGIRHEWLTFPGAHEWKVWRHSLAALLPRLFPPAPAP
jgi:enterochelin esterase family protein